MDISSMKSAILFTDSGPIVVVSPCRSLSDDKVLQNLRAKGIVKFVGFELPTEMVRTRYGNHFDVACEDLHECGDLRVIDYNGPRVFSMFKLDEYGTPFNHQPTDEEELAVGIPSGGSGRSTWRLSW